VSKAVLLTAMCLLLNTSALVGQEIRLQDPTSPYRAAPAPSTRAPAAARFELTAVLISPHRRIAVINGRLYREGDTVNDATISVIDPGLVRLRRGSENLEVRLMRKGAGAQIRQGDSSS